MNFITTKCGNYISIPTIFKWNVFCLACIPQEFIKITSTKFLSTRKGCSMLLRCGKTLIYSVWLSRDQNISGVSRNFDTLKCHVWWSRSGRDMYLNVASTTMYHPDGWWLSFNWSRFVSSQCIAADRFTRPNGSDVYQWTMNWWHLYGHQFLDCNVLAIWYGYLTIIPKNINKMQSKLYKFILKWNSTQTKNCFSRDKVNAKIPIKFQLL